MPDIDELIRGVSLTLNFLGPQEPNPVIPVAQILGPRVENIDQALVEASAWYAWVGERWARVRAARTAVERRKSETFAQLATEARENLQGKVTEKAIEQAVRAHPDYQAINESMVRASYEEDVLQVMLKAIELRNDELRTISANRRTEYTTTPGSTRH